MKLLITLYSLLLLSHSSVSQTQSRNYEFSQGQWFDGKKFVKKTMFAVEGVWVNERPDRIDSVFNLQNNFVIPPLSEVHTHSLDAIGYYKQTIARYLNDGVFYVKNPNNIGPWTKNIMSEINGPNKLDGSFANGGLTSTGGHPEILYEDRIRVEIGPHINNAPRGFFKNKSYFNIDSKADLEAQWSLILAGEPNFIKVYLANSEDIGNTPPTSRYTLRKGLHPAIVSGIVRKAHETGLRVSAHVETRADFLEALKAGVDEITHTPGFYLFSKDELDRYRLKIEDAKLAAEKGVFVVTALLSRNLTEDPELFPLVKEMQAYNLSLLKKHGAKIVIGSDHANSPWDEVRAIQELDVFDNLTLLKMWCETSPQAIFPDRKLGFFKPGYEASFLALPENPLIDLENATDISLLVKQGIVIEKTELPEPSTSHEH